MHPRLAWRHRELLAEDDPLELDPVAAAQLQALRSQHQFLRAAGVLCQVAGRRFTLHIYAGTRINKTLEVPLRPHVARVSAGNFELSGTLQTGQDAGELLERLQAWSGGISDEERRQAVQDLQPLPLSKYLPYLPPRMRQTVVADHLLDVEGLEAHLLAQELRLMRDAVN